MRNNPRLGYNAWRGYTAPNRRERLYMSVSHRTIVIIAAVIWYGGGISLIVKGGVLIGDAYGLGGQSAIALAAGLAGIAAGLIKARFIFNRSCRKNLKRIAALSNPRVWQCFRPGFLLFLAIIIPTGAWMSRAAEGSFVWLCVVGALDLSIATALLVSSAIFWRTRAFTHPV
jgi:hypothetical protein